MPTYLLQITVGCQTGNLAVDIFLLWFLIGVQINNSSCTINARC